MTADRPLPEWAHRRVVTIDPGSELVYEPAEWLDAIVAVRGGRIALVTATGCCTWFGAGDILWFAGLPIRTIRNEGADAAVLVSVARRAGRRDERHDAIG